MTTGYVYEPIYLEHTLSGHPENRERLVAIMDLLQETGTLNRLEKVPASPISQVRLELNHTARYIEEVRRVAERGGGHLDPDTYVGPRSYEAALMAAGGLVNLTEAVLDGVVDNGFALVRPPGHHALAGRGMGFCLFNNVAIAAHCALAERGLERILIVDFDVHHGNGTQDSFHDSPEVLYLSTHQYPHYPGTGHWQDIGRGAGAGYTVNLPLSRGVGDAGYGRIFAEVLAPLARRYRPRLILASAGYDAHWADPLAGMLLSITGYAALARRLKALAEELCEGQIVFVLEGGYHQQVLRHAVLNTFKALLGDEDVVDPLGLSPQPEVSINDLLASVKRVHGLA
ncbi:MAG: histone deacetylase [Chloroflexota bacterium]|nr:histone deacetylase [Chloroflexota bacterium]